LESLRKQFDSTPREPDSLRSKIGTALDHVFGRLFQVLIGLWIAALYGYLFYSLLKWLFVGEGQGVLAIGTVVGVIALVFGGFPYWMSKRTGQSIRECQSTINTFIFVVGGLILGSYWIPKEFGFALAWYWRVVLGIAVMFFGLATRRDYP